MNLIYRLSLWSIYRLLLAFWWLTRPDHHGALVALWVDGRILVVRTSYRGTWQLPGGSINRGESGLRAAVRECHEELGIALDPDSLILEQDATHFHDFRDDHTLTYAVTLSREPQIKIDRREIVEARFASPEETCALDIPEYLREYLSTPDIAERPRCAHRDLVAAAGGS